VLNARRDFVKGSTKMTSRSSNSLLILSCLVLLLPVMAMGAENWRPIDPGDLALKNPVVEKDADAEAIFWEVKVADEYDGGSLRTVFNHYLRIKIFTERGRESQSRIDIPYFNNWSIKDIAARTVKPDGTIIELKKEDVFERTIVKASGVKLRAKSFAMPGVEPGAIIEYRYREVRNDQLADYLRLQFQRDVPVQLVKYYLKPLDNPIYGMRAKAFQADPGPITKEKEGYYSTIMRNVRAFHEEARMPPDDSVRPWLLIYYSEDRKVTADQYWKDLGKSKYETYKSMMKVSDEVKQAAAKAVGDATAPEQKLERIFEFCRTSIKNVNNDSSGMTPEERAKVKENKSPADTLKRGAGTGANIDMLFAAMANAAGFDARVVNLGDRGDVFLDRSFPDDYFIRTYDIAVRVGEKWLFYDPASTYVPHGMLRWQEEGQDALLSDPKEPIWIKTPFSSPEKTKTKRVAKLKLSDDGTIEGDVVVEYYGHVGVEKKNENDGDSESEREETLRDTVKSRMSTAELSEMKIENVKDPIKPFTYRYHVRVPGYAQRTGKRLFIQPAFFQRGLDPLFSSSERTNDVYFHYSWSEVDEVTIDLPEGYALDSPESPSPFSGGAISEYKPLASITKDGKTLIYKRNFFFGGKDTILFPASSYAQLKNYFQQLHKQDNHTITLKQTAASN
jgi:transglutaminase-like putative cysteine protease